MEFALQTYEVACEDVSRIRITGFQRQAGKKREEALFIAIYISQSHAAGRRTSQASRWLVRGSLDQCG